MLVDNNLDLVGQLGEEDEVVADEQWRRRRHGRQRSLMVPSEEVDWNEEDMNLKCSKVLLRSTLISAQVWVVLKECRAKR